MKLIVQIPCFNEEATLPAVLAEIPRQIAGVDAVEVLVIDDGSTDRTGEVARVGGADHVVRHRANRGLAAAFSTGLEACLGLGADVIVNTDGDNQYRGEAIPALIQPILEGRADIVVGDRRPASLPHFSPSKRLLQRLGSAVMRWLSRTDVPDAVSGFRAMSREAALDLNIVSSFSYTTDMLIQAGRKGMCVTAVTVPTNAVQRDSRLFASSGDFVKRSAVSMLRAYSMYQPLRVFLLIGSAAALLGLLPIVRFLYFFVAGQGEGHVQSLVLGGALLVIGFLTFVIGLLADLVSFNRKLLETIARDLRRHDLEEPHRAEPVAAEDREPLATQPRWTSGG
ncbi:MAG TPA: glycosyltransferase family 2 protein [Thermoanaerobaculia bacterium]|nr:glycosyltransferase family 2 protein [Thermoanaerobaculia bacterium]